MIPCRCHHKEPGTAGGWGNAPAPCPGLKRFHAALVTAPRGPYFCVTHILGTSLVSNQM